MVILYSKFILSSVISRNSSKNLGSIESIVFDRKSFCVAAIIMKKSFFFSPTKVISANDILEASQNAILVSSEDSPVSIKELPKLNQSLKSFPVGIGQKVITYSSKKVGAVRDILIDLETKQIRSLYVNNLLDERIIPISTVMGFEKGVFIIKDEFSEIKIPSLASQTVSQ